MFKNLPMRNYVVAAVCAATFTLFGSTGPLMAQTADPQAPANPEGVTTLEEGPIHEAFASPTAADPRQGQVVAKTPPDPVEEVPPEVKPEGDNYKWISGYWQWDPVRDDFVWVSGVYRKFPPNHNWVPGHWAQTTGGHTWISGYWESGQRQQAEYLPYPPESLEEGPTSLTPGDNYFWIPGCWEWRSGRYAWRAGYWYEGQPNWVWSPSYYSYTPRGAIYIRGFWDFPLALRGVLYAPVYFEGPFYRQSGFYFTPSYVVDCYDVLPYLYVHRGYNHFYFGRYTGYSRYGFDPWYGGGRHRWYNSLFAYHSWHDDRGRGDWFREHKRDFDRRKDWDGDRRGRGDRDWDRDRDRDRDGKHRLTRSYDDWRGEHKGNYRKLDSDERQKLKQNANNWQDVRRQRARNEGANKSAENRDFVTQFQGDRTGRGSRRDGDGDRQTRLRVPQDGQSAGGQQQFQRRSSDRSQRDNQQSLGSDQQFQRRSFQRNDNNEGGQGSQSARTQRSFSNERSGNQGRNLDQSQFRVYQREQSDAARSLRTESGNNSGSIRTSQRRGDSDVQTRSYNRESSQPRSFQRSESQGRSERSMRSSGGGDRGSSARSFSGGGGERSSRSFSGGGGDRGSSARSSSGGGSSRGSSARSFSGGGDRGGGDRGGGGRGGGGGGGRSSGKYGGGRDRD